MDTKTLFMAVLVAGMIGGFALNNSLFRDVAGLDDTIEVGTEAPDFTLVDPDGNQFTLSDFEGEKVIVLEFMSMSCGTCKNFEENTLKDYCNEAMPDDVKDITGRFFANCKVKKGSAKAKNEEHNRRLWEISEEAVAPFL